MHEAQDRRSMREGQREKCERPLSRHVWHVYVPQVLATSWRECMSVVLCRRVRGICAEKCTSSQMRQAHPGTALRKYLVDTRAMDRALLPVNTSRKVCKGSSYAACSVVKACELVVFRPAHAYRGFVINSRDYTVCSKFPIED